MNSRMTVAEMELRWYNNAALAPKKHTIYYRERCKLLKHILTGGPMAAKEVQYIYSIVYNVCECVSERERKTIQTTVSLSIQNDCITQPQVMIGTSHTAHSSS